MSSVRDQAFVYEDGVEWRRNDDRFPAVTFDPKAVTRASWEAKQRKQQKQQHKPGPLVSFNRHPDAYEVPTGGSTVVSPLRANVKGWIRGTRVAQLVLRSLELTGAAGLLGLMVLITDVASWTVWVLRLTPGLAGLACVYSICHHSRPAGRRTAASSAAYQLFAALSDVAVVAVYGFCAFTVAKNGNSWSTLLPNKSLKQYLVPAEFYTLIATAALHLVSLPISVWLAHIFRRIAKLPLDMNPLEGSLTARRRKDNRASTATGSTDMAMESKRLAGLERHRRSGAPYEHLSRLPTLPFLHTRSDSHDSGEDSLMPLPHRKYQVLPTQSPARPLPRRPGHRASSHYVDVPLHTDIAGPARLSHHDSDEVLEQAKATTGPWFTSDSLKGRARNRPNETYDALTQTYDDEEDEWQIRYHSEPERDAMQPESDSDDQETTGGHPNPLRSHPMPVDASAAGSRGRARHRGPSPSPNRSLPLQQQRVHALSSSLGAEDARRRRLRGRGRGADGSPYSAADDTASSTYSLSRPALDDASSSVYSSYPAPAEYEHGAGLYDDDDDDGYSYRYAGAGDGDGLSVRTAAAAASRKSSVQTDAAFQARPYGDLRAGTPPVRVVGPGVGVGVGPAGRQVSSSSAVDYSFRSVIGFGKYRRNVSGKVVEEGRGADGLGRP